MSSSTKTIAGWPMPTWQDFGKAVSHANLLAAYVALCCASLVPFVVIAHPPIVDFANHAARLSLACDQANADVAAMYRYGLGIIPNLAVDLANVPLCGVMAPAAVLKLITVGSLLLIYVSGWLIQRKLFGRANAFLFALPAIAFNLVTTMGYINFLAGVAVTCLMTALAIGRELRFRKLLLLGNVGGAVLFFCHVFALVFAMLIFFGLMMRGSSFTARRLADAAWRTGAMFALPLALLLFVPNGTVPFSIGFTHKVRMLPALFMTQHPGPGMYGLLLLVPLYLLLRERSVVIHRDLRVSLAVVGLFVLVIPCSLLDAVDIDSRLLVALAYLFFPALKPCRREREITLVTGSIAAALVVFQLWSAATIWTSFSRQVDELQSASDILPARARVLTVAGSGDPKTMVADSLAYSHVTSYLTIERRIFNPLEFTGVGMQPLSVTPQFAAVDSPTGQPYSPAIANRFIDPDKALEKLAKENEAGFALRWPRNFDFVIFYHFGGAHNFNPALLEDVRDGSFFSILKVKHPNQRPSFQ